MGKSPVSCIVLLSATGIGTGVLVLPKAMASVGYFPMTMILFVGFLITALTTLVLFEAVQYLRRNQGATLLTAEIEMGSKPTNGAARAGDLNSPARAGPAPRDPNWPSYADVVVIATFPQCGVVLDTILFFYGFGAVVGYFIFIASFLHALPLWPEFLTVNRTVVILACVLYPLTLPSSVAKLSSLGSLTLTSLALMTLAEVCYAPQAIAQRTAPVVGVEDVGTAPQVICLTTFAMMWHTNAVAVARELERPTFDRCFLVSFGGSAGIAMIYGLSAFVGYVSWGSATKASIVDMYPKDDLVFTVIRLMLTASLCVTAPMNMYPVRESCVSLIRVARPDFEHTHTVRAVLGALLIFGAAGVAILYPQVLAIMSLLGGVFATWLMIVFPAWISKLLLPRRSWNVVMVIAALLAVFLTLAALNVIGDEIPA